MDAVDAALVQFIGDRPILLATHKETLPVKLYEELLKLTQPKTNELERMGQLDSTLARVFASTVHKLLDKTDVAPKQIRAIGSHGQTIRHLPNGNEPFTIQIGNPNLLTELTGITTVGDFRRRDMAAGGQGAPLAPAFHAAFFQDSGESRAIVNIGGIANLTVLPSSTRHSKAITGFDTGPGNVLLDAWVQKHLKIPADWDGVWGSKGEVIPDLLEHWLKDSYFKLPPPKSTGREYFNLTWLESRLAAYRKPVAAQDVQTTLIELTAGSIATAIQHFAKDVQRVLVCGGGVHNSTLMISLRRQLVDLPVTSTATYGIDPDYVEAIGFAWLARRTLHGLSGNLPAVTGAKGLRVLGGIYPA